MEFKQGNLIFHSLENKPIPGTTITYESYFGGKSLEQDKIDFSVFLKFLNQVCHWEMFMTKAKFNKWKSKNTHDDYLFLNEIKAEPHTHDTINITMKRDVRSTFLCCQIASCALDTNKTPNFIAFDYGDTGLMFENDYHTYAFVATQIRTNGYDRIIKDFYPIITQNGNNPMTINVDKNGRDFNTESTLNGLKKFLSERTGFKKYRLEYAIAYHNNNEGKVIRYLGSYFFVSQGTIQFLDEELDPKLLYKKEVFRYVGPYRPLKNIVK